MSQRINTAEWLKKYKRWQINVQKDGERKSFTSSIPGRNGQREANSKADAWLDSDVSGKEHVEELFASFLEHKRIKSEEQWINDESIGRTWILPAIGRMKIGKVTEGKLQEIIDGAYTTKDLSKKTLENIRGTISNFLKYCRKHEKTTLHPEDLEIPNGAKEGERHVLQPEHLVILLASDKTKWRNKVMVDPLINAYRLEVLTGLRPGEIIGLEWTDIQNDCIMLKRSVNVRNRVTKGKNKKAKRSFKLTPSVKEVLNNQIELDCDGIRVFGDKLKEQRYRKQWYRYLDHNGIPRITPYEMRHTFVSIVKGLTDAERKLLVGHSVSMDTDRVYSHEMDGDKERIAAKIESIFQDIVASAS